MPGSDLSQPAMETRASKRSACMTSSTESAITSRETSEARIPSCPIAMPSETAMVEKTKPTPPDPATPAFACFDNSGPVRLHGVTSLPADTTPTWGFSKSSSDNPTARNMARAPALADPSVTSCDLIFNDILGRCYGPVLETAKIRPTIIPWQRSTTTRTATST